MAYLGNPGGTGQVLTVSGGAPVWGGESRPALDANHIHAWYLDEISGGNFTRAAGAVDLSVGANVAVRYGAGIYRSLKAATYTSASGNSFCTASGLSISNSTSITMEVILRLVPYGISAYSGAAVVTITDTGYTTTHADIRIQTGDIFAQRWDSVGSYIYVSTGAAYNQWDPNIAHHLMVTWVPGGDFKFFLDGFERPSTLGGSTRTNAFSECSLRMYPGMSFADYRISNIARDAAYAQAATIALRGM